MMKMFKKDEYAAVFKIKIIYKNGSSVEGWFSKFDKSGSEYTWSEAIDPNELFELKKGYVNWINREERVEIINEYICNMISPLILNVDEIQSVFQMRTMLSPVFTEEFEEEVKKFLDKYV